MERFYKIIFVGVFCLISLLSNAWAGIIAFALLAQLSTIYTKSSWSLVLLPIVFSMIAFIGGSFIWMTLGLLACYVIRIIDRDILFNDSQLWLFFLLLFVGAYCWVPYLFVVPLILLSISIPVVKIDKCHIETPWIILPNVIVILVLSLAIGYCCWGYGTPKHRAYLQKGVWAQAKVPYKIDDLRNASCYSYSEFVHLINADTISNINEIDKYNEIWIVTPTTPFSADELKKLKHWVFTGGNLIMVSDHTDLYGHARCVSQVAQLFGCVIHNSATFDKNDKQVFRNAFAQCCDIKTGTNMTGMVFPMLSAWMWEEDAYYANDNFFGPLAASGDDVYGDKILHGQISYGLGQVNFLQDSTIFSNFAVYQPFIMDMVSSLSNHSFISRLLSILPLIFILGILLVYYDKKKAVATFSLFSILCYPYSDAGSFDYGDRPQIWTGQSSFVQEGGCPYTKISTAYSLASLSKRKPLWKSKVDKRESDVIWVDSVPPPNCNWRWIKVTDIHRTEEYSGPWEPLHRLFKSSYIKKWDLVNDDYNVLDVNSVFSDKVMNDWWYNDGISQVRYARIRAWLSWLNRSDEEVLPIEYNANDFSEKLYDAWVRIEQHTPVKMKLPMPTSVAPRELYLGYGVVGIKINRGDTISIFGKSQFSEDIEGPKIWAIEYLPKLKN